MSDVPPLSVAEERSLLFGRLVEAINRYLRVLNNDSRYTKEDVIAKLAELVEFYQELGVKAERQ